MKVFRYDPPDRPIRYCFTYNDNFLIIDNNFDAGKCVLVAESRASDIGRMIKLGQSLSPQQLLRYLGERKIKQVLQIMRSQRGEKK